MKKKKRSKVHNKGFSLVELMVVMAILAALVLIAVPSYKGHIKRGTQQVCNANCMQLERMYHAYLLMENKDHTAFVFNEFLQKHEGTICPANGDIKYVHGIVRCILHSEDKSNDDEDDESVPFL